MVDHTLLLQDKHLIFDPRRPVDPVTGAQVCTGWTHGFENKLLMMHMASPREAETFKARLYNLSFEGADADYGEREIGEIFSAWGIVKESRRKVYFYLIFASLLEREFVRWKVFGKA